MMSLTSSTRWSYGVRIVVGEDISISFAVEHVRSLTELPGIHDGTPFPITGVEYRHMVVRRTVFERQDVWRSADRHQLLDRVPGKGAVDDRRHH